MPKKTESTGTGLESYVAKLMGNGSNRTSVTEDEIQVALKDIDVSDEQLNAVYSALRNSGIQIISASGNDDAPMDVDDDDNDTDDFDDDEHDSGSLDDHELKMARQADAEMGSSKSKKKRTVRTSRSRSRVRGIDASTVMLTGDPVRMYLKEIGKVDLLTASEEVDLAMKIEAGLEATEKLEAADAGEIELTRSEMRRLTRIENVGLEAKQALISANLRLVVSIAKRYVGRGMALSSPRTPRGGSVRPLRALLPTRPVPSVFPCTWSRPSTSSSASSASSSRTWVATRPPRRSVPRWT